MVIVMAKRKKATEKISLDTETSVSGGVKLVIVIIVIFAAFYLLTVLILNKKSTKIETNSSIQYTKILAGTTFNQKDSDYLVFFYDYDNDENASDYADLASKYRSKKKSLPLYTVDLSEGLNKKYISNDENKDVLSIKDLKVKGATIIRIKDHKNVSYVTEGFSDYLDSTTK